MNKEIDCRGTDEVICPYCGYDNGGDDGYGPPSGIQECYNEDCKKKFECEPNFYVSYYTSKVPCLNGEPHRWGETYWYSDNIEGARSCRDCHKQEWIKKEVK